MNKTDYEIYLNLIQKSGIEHIIVEDEDYDYIVTHSDIDDCVVAHQFENKILLDIYIANACATLEDFKDAIEL